jgi:hypothetical protein
MHNHWLFFGNVVAHWGAFMSGSLSFILCIVEYWRKRKLEGWAFAVIALICFFVACDAAWQDEHRNCALLIDEKSVAIQAQNFWKEQSYAKDATLRTRDDLLAKNYTALTNEQDSANKSQGALSRLSEKILEVSKERPQITTVLPIGRDDGKFLQNAQGENVTQYLLTTNKDKNNTIVNIVCSQPQTKIPKVFVLTQTGGATFASHQHPNPNIYRFSVGTAWTPQTPMLVEFSFTNIDSTFNCTITTE